jgi:hypothetical protein
MQTNFAVFTVPVALTLFAVCAAAQRGVVKESGQCVSTIAALRALAVPLVPPGELPCRQVLGFHSLGDEGGGFFYWDATSHLAPDGGLVFSSTHPNAPPGRWRRAFTGPVEAAWWGLAGNGVVNDTAPLQAAFAAAAGRGIVFAKPLTYAFDALVVPNDVRMANNGATFLLRSSPAGIATAITLGARVQADLIKVRVAAGVTVQRLLMLGEDNDIGSIQLTAVDQQTRFPDNLDGALQIRFPGVRVGAVNVDRFNKGVMVYAGSRVHIGHVTVRNYVLGVHVRESNFVEIVSADIKTAVTTAFVAGNNGILIEDSFDIVLSDAIVHDAAEHAVRVGGSGSSARLVFNNIQTVRSGGCGLKLRANPGQRVRNVQINGLTVIDASANSTPNYNRDGLRLEGCSNVTANGVQVQAETRTYSANDGIWVTNCDNVTINGPRITNALYNGIHINDIDGVVNQIYINNPVVLVSATNGIFINSPTQILRDITILRAYVRNFGGWGVYLQANSGTSGVNQPVILDGFVRNDVGVGAVFVATTDPDVRNLLSVF